MMRRVDAGKVNNLYFYFMQACFFWAGLFGFYFYGKNLTVSE